MTNASAAATNTERLRRSAPRVHAALAQLRTVTDRDGALDAGTKAVLMAVAAAAQRDRILASRELGRATDLGVDPGYVWAAGAVLLSSRGEGAYDRFASAAFERLGDPQVDVRHPDPTSQTADVVHAERMLSAASGSLPEYARLLRDLAPNALVAYADLLAEVQNQPQLPMRDVQLILVCVNVAACRPEFAAHHSRLARRAGASDAQIVEAGVCAIPSGGVTAWYAAGGQLQGGDR